MDFIKMRQQIAQQVPVKPEKGKDSLRAPPKPEVPEVTLAYIIEEKPGKKKVKKYLEHRKKEFLEEMES
jgi:hypothetical protein